MRGEDVKKILRDKGFVMSEIASIIGKSPQNLDGQLKSDDVRSGLLESIAKSVGYGMDLFYQELKKTSENDIPILFENNYLKQLIEQQKYTMETQKKLIASLERNIADLELQLQLKENEEYNLKKEAAHQDDSADYAAAK
ncbi:hypothetical protein [Bacteroides pyogenes]|uniref:hypothetical protein n=1 Tax=Bacteroides pyogenes TaxID=310300 RepID=UPI001BADC419|nr:hypothetical protein [Bacteroides pyogenes]MBR8726015.1 hypothetical protein [Bacteroides pyogenes]MBR8739295.1 hypothetical protein [Bacteroides pyogenes]MBR8755155.1 hypothetical protein [Bacteroides pyogenes]MBR8796501.1 hypothetical protein [Bacteroides pyogenes]MBR8810009.1 hypothetical protein [Bacteroides pyogenes]